MRDVVRKTPWTERSPSARCTSTAWSQRLMLLGWRVVRFTWRQVIFEPAYVAATLQGLLARS